MADAKISQLAGATTPLVGTEVLPVVQGGTTVKVSAADITAGRAVNAGSLVVNGATVVNEAGGDADFRVEGDNNTHLLFCDASSDRVGIRKSVPDTVFNIGFAGADQIQTFRLEGSNGSSERYALDLVADGENAFTRIRTGLGGGTPTDKITIDPSSNVAITLGNLVIGTSGKGIDFSATPGTGTSELFSDYEEGTYTAELTSVGGGTITVSSSFNTLAYTRIGRMVYVQGYITASAISSPTGELRLNLPFSTASAAQISQRGSWGTGYISVLGSASSVANGFQMVWSDFKSYVSIYVATGNSVTDAADQILGGGNTDIRLGFCYVAA
jgi:hypothetical protein